MPYKIALRSGRQFSSTGRQSAPKALLPYASDFSRIESLTSQLMSAFVIWHKISPPHLLSIMFKDNWVLGFQVHV